MQIWLEKATRYSKGWFTVEELEKSSLSMHKSKCLPCPSSCVKFKIKVLVLSFNVIFLTLRNEGKVLFFPPQKREPQIYVYIFP